MRSQAGSVATKNAFCIALYVLYGRLGRILRVMGSRYQVGWVVAMWERAETFALDRPLMSAPMVIGQSAGVACGEP